VRQQDLPRILPDLRRHHPPGAGARHRRAVRVGQGHGGGPGAAALGFDHLDSGALYRIVALAALEKGVALDDEAALAGLAAALPARFEGDKVLLDGRDVSDAIRSEACSVGASRVAALPAVREALFWRQRAYRRGPGLVGEGRDMGSVIFPDAPVKIFLTASAEARADRRYKQLIDKGMPANMDDLLRDLRERDERDSRRAVAPSGKKTMQRCSIPPT
jgi:3-phosphoshikimate 1-carboxyvinyltransferase